MQGYNTQAATNDQHIVIAAEINADSPDFGHLQPMGDAAQHELAALGICESPTVSLADAGYWHQDQIQNIVDRGIQVLIPPDAGKRKGNRPGWDGGPYSFMRRVKPRAAAMGEDDRRGAPRRWGRRCDGVGDPDGDRDGQARPAWAGPRSALSAGGRVSLIHIDVGAPERLDGRLGLRRDLHRASATSRPSLASTS